MINYYPILTRKLPFETAIFCVFFMIAAILEPGGTEPMPWIIGSLCFALCVCAAIIRHWAHDHNDDRVLAMDRVEALEKRVHEYLKAKQDVDVWRPQKDLMLASDQHVGERPWVGKSSLLYAALILEEGAELMAALNASLHRQLSIFRMEGDPEHETSLRIVSDSLTHISQSMADTSKGIRGRLSYVPDDWGYAPVFLHAIEILDGVTDLHVVAAGFSITTGLPGREAYEEVAGSNLSKANPRTGKIDKDASGKWIKGSQYRPPNLSNILATQAARAPGAEKAQG